LAGKALTTTPGPGKPKRDPVADALAVGQLWRAKEILSGRVGSGVFDPELYERLGQVLLRMGDDLEAGRYLFLSGVRRAEYQASIDLYTQRHIKRRRRDLLATFPAAVRRLRWSDLPISVQEELVEAGVPRRANADLLWGLAHDRPKGAGGAGCTLAVLLLLGLGLLASVVVVYFFES
jgi:hypothetical protein